MTDAAARRQLILDGIAAAARRAGRDSGEVELIAVTKGRTVAEIEALVAAGQREFAENRVQEALAKWPALRARQAGLRLHFVGRLQSNKAREAAGLFDVIHSVDRPSLIAPLAGLGRQIYLQVNIGDEPQKGGCAIGEVPQLTAAARDAGLDLAGLMAIPPQGLEPSPFFALLAKLARREGLAGLSMGMSNDYPAAVMLGATAVRIGSSLFEDR